MPMILRACSRWQTVLSSSNYLRPEHTPAPNSRRCALRVKGLPIATIARLYFDPDEHEMLDVERLLRTMRDDLVSIALREGSSVLVEHLQASIRKHGEPRLTPVSLQLIEQAASGWARAAPAPEHTIALVPAAGCAAVGRRRGAHGGRARGVL